MVDNKSDLKSDVRNFTGYDTSVLSSDGLDTSYRTAKRHIRVSKGLAASFDFYNTEFPSRQDALFWWTCLFCKVQAGELDEATFQSGAVDEESLLAKEDDEVTVWYRRANNALRAITASSVVRTASPARDSRQYEVGTYGEQDGSSSTEVDATNL